MARMPQAIGNYGLGARLPSSFTGGSKPIEDSPLTERNTPMTNNPGGNTPAREISSAVTGLMVLEAMQAISNHLASAVPMSRDQVPSGKSSCQAIRKVHQVLEEVEDRADSLASNMIKRESPYEYDLGE